MIHINLLIVTVLVLFARQVIVVAAGANGRISAFHELGMVVFGLYLLFVSSLTVNYARILQGQFSRAARYNLIPFAGIRDVLSHGGRYYIIANVVGNVVLFFPLGVFLPLLWRKWTLPRTVLCAFSLSAGIELLQFYTGRSADVDDVILNTLGAAIGYLIYCLIRLCAPVFSGYFRARPAKSAPRPALFGRFHLIVFSGVLIMVVGFALALPRGNLHIPQSRLRPDTVVGTGAGILSVSAKPNSKLEIGVLHSRNMILIDLHNDSIVCRISAEETIYPASMTKIMTALIALEQLPDLQQPVLLGEDIFADIYKANASTAGFLPGEEVPAIDLLYGVMLPSGAECSIGLAEHVAGSVEAFVVLMNEKARELGMHHTNFTNPTGLHSRNHYSTVEDIAILLRHALDSERFRGILMQDRYHTARTNLHPEGITFYSTLSSRAQSMSFPGGSIMGGKTGYTHEAGQCLASVAQVGDRAYLLVTAGAYPKDSHSEQLDIEDALAVYSGLREAE